MNRALRSSRVVTLATLVGLFCLAAATLIWSNPTSHPSLSSEVKIVASQLRCPICQGESVYDSPSGMAAAMRRIIRKQLHAGRTESQVKAFFVRRYGDWILLAPPATGVSILLWLGPPALLGIGLGLIVFAGMRWRKNRRLPRDQVEVNTQEDAEVVAESLRSRLEMGELSPSEFELSRSALPKTWVKPAPKRPVEMFALQLLGMVAAAVLVGAIVSLVYQPEVTTRAGGLTLAQALHRAQAKTQKHPRSVGAWQTYAQLEMLQAQTQSRRPLYLAALKSYQTLEQLQPSPSNKLDLAYLDVTLRRPQSALDILSAVNAKNAPKSLMLRGLAYQEQGKKDPAIQSFREFLRRAPHSTLAKSVRGWLQRLEK